MKIIVQKYGGSSLATAARIKNVAKKIVALQRRKKGVSLVIIVSAMGKTTNKLINLANMVRPPTTFHAVKELRKSGGGLEGREIDKLLATGEKVSASLLALAIKSSGTAAISLTGAEAGIITDNMHTKAKILFINPERIRKELKRKRVVIVAGFQGLSERGETTTLGRGASDLSAVALAKALRAERCEIFSDVKGVYTADPSGVKAAKKISQISYDEALEMAGCGAQVIQGRALELAKKSGIPLFIGSSFSKTKGTIIGQPAKFGGGSVEAPLVSNVTLNEAEAKVSIFRVADSPGIAARIFAPIARTGINVDMIVQNVSKAGYTDLSFTVSIGELERTIKIAKKVARQIGAGNVTFDKDIARVSIIGLGMLSHPGVAVRMFSVLAKNRINIKMITTSEIKISTVVPKKDGKKALRVVHKEFIG